MLAFQQRVLVLIEQNLEINLLRGGSYQFIVPTETTTTVNGILFPRAFHYRISPIETKKITIEFIHFMYQHSIQTGTTPSRAIMREQFPHEFCPRPCNYSVAINIVDRLIREDNN
jgi:hypothetical protein